MAPGCSLEAWAGGGGEGGTRLPPIPTLHTESLRTRVVGYPAPMVLFCQDQSDIRAANTETASSHDFFQKEYSEEPEGRTESQKTKMEGGSQALGTLQYSEIVHHSSGHRSSLQIERVLCDSKKRVTSHIFI